jgi:putative ABC transport system ATP-binding protein
MAGTDLEARDIVLMRAGKPILSGASLTVQAGETVSIEGASGSGKSTLLRVMATLLEMTSGQVLLGGVDARSLSPRVFRKRVAYVPQLPPMFEGTVASNVAAGPSLRGLKLERGAVVRLLERVGLGADFHDRDPRNLSGGERQRVALARALANEPEVLLLDEPTSALDQGMAERIIELIRSLSADGHAIAIVTHIEEHAAALAGRRYVCAGGKVSPRGLP